MKKILFLILLGTLSLKSEHYRFLNMLPNDSEVRSICENHNAGFFGTRISSKCNRLNNFLEYVQYVQHVDGYEALSEFGPALDVFFPTKNEENKEVIAKELSYLVSLAYNLEKKPK